MAVLSGLRVVWDDDICRLAWDQSKGNPEEFPSLSTAVPEADDVADPLMDEECLDVKGDCGTPPESTELLSVGSALHASGDCKPCANIVRVRRCKQEASCNFCHALDHVQRPDRPSKAKREKYRKLVSMLFRQIEQNPAVFDPETQRLAPALSSMIPQPLAGNPRLMAKMHRRLQDHALRCSVKPDPPLRYPVAVWQPLHEVVALSQGGRVQEVGPCKIEMLSL